MALETSQEKVLHIERLSAKGRGVCDQTEVVGALPGEEVLVHLGPKRRKKRVGSLREVLTPSPDRQEPRCSHSPACGGCTLQHMDYAAQLKHKQDTVATHFESLIEQHKVELAPIIGCTDPFQYRNKMEFSFSENKAQDQFLGLMLAGERGKVFNLTECHLTDKWFACVLHTVRLWWEESSLSAYHHHTDTGQLRTVTLRKSLQGTGTMVMLTVSGNPEFALKKSQIDSFVAALKKNHPDPNFSIFLQVHQIKKGLPTQFFEMLLSGPDHIEETLYVPLFGKTHSLNFKISPTSFFQPNTRQAEKLYSKALSLLTHLKNGRVFDLYCGAATIGITAAKEAKEVVGIELNPHAVFDAQWNCETNQTENVMIYRGDVAKLLSEHPDPDVVIVDPPRAGLGEKATRLLGSTGAKEILYISCNPKTQAEDIALLTAISPYRLVQIQPVDQFPHTMHIENIALLQTSDGAS